MNPTTSTIVLWIARLISFILVLERSRSIWIAIVCLIATMLATFEVLISKAMHNLKIDQASPNDIDAIAKETTRLEQTNLPWLILAYLFFPMVFEIINIIANR